MAENSNGARKAAPWVLSFLVLAILRLWLTSEIPVALLDHDVDDSLYLRHAAAIADGEWLGPYDHNLLVKGPGYGAFLALATTAGIPRRLAEDLLQILAALVMVWCLRRLGVPLVLSLLAFGLLLFHPGCIHGAGTRVAREGVYLAQTVLVLALGGALIPSSSLRARLVIATALGFVLSWAWQTRGEGVWFAPPLLVCGVAAVVVDRRAGARTAAGLVAMGGCAVITALIVVAGGALVASLNEKHYGAAVTTELKDAPFNRAVGAIQRVADSRWSRYEPLAPELRDKLAAASPAFAEIRPVLEQRISVSGPPTQADDGEMMGIFLSWALRDAAAAAGHHATLPDSRAFYSRLADEINAACDAGALPCGAARSGQTPRLDSSLFGTLAARLRDHERELLSPSWIRLAPEPPLPLDLVGPEKRAVAESVLGAPLVGDGVVSLHRRWAGLRTLSTASRQGGLALRVLGIACLLGLALTRRGRGSPAFWLGVAIEAALLTRAGLVATLETYWFRDVAIYLVPAAPLGGLVGVAALGSFLTEKIPHRIGWFCLLVTVVAAAVAATGPGATAGATTGLGEGLLLVGERDALAAVHGGVKGPVIRHGAPLELNVVSPTRSRGVLELEVACEGAELATLQIRSLRFADDAIRPVVRRRFITRARLLRIPIDVLPAHPLRLSVTEEDAVIMLGPARIDWTDRAPAAPPSLDVARRGDRVEASIEGGAPDGVYVVFFSRERLAKPTVDPALSGGGELDPATTVLAGGVPLRLIVEVDGSGRGRASLPAGDIEPGTWAQGVGEDWFTSTARVGP